MNGGTDRGKLGATLHHVLEQAYVVIVSLRIYRVMCIAIDVSCVGMTCIGN